LLLTACTPTSSETDATSDDSLTLSGPDGPKGTDFWDVFGTPESSESVGDIHSLQERRDAPTGSQGRNMVYVSEISPDTCACVSGQVSGATSHPAQPRYLILWHHEPAGLADNCAPSRRTVSEERVPVLEELLELGHIVLMSDYAGQGLPGPTYSVAGDVNS